MTKITRIPKDPGASGWNKILDPPDQAVALEENRTSDWLVIGGGFAGLTALRRLSEHCPNDNITLLEAGRIGEGPAGRNSGFMVDLPHDLSSKNYGGKLEADRTQIADNRRAIDYAGEMAKEFDLPPEAFVRSGKMNAAASKKGAQHNRDYAQHLTALGEAHRMLDAQEMREITGSDYYQSGLYTPGAVMLHPAMYIRGIAKGLRTNRVSLYEMSPVRALEKKGKLWVAQTEKGQISAPKVILAVNGHLESFGFMKRRLMHIFTYASMTRAFSPGEITRLGGERVWGATPADPLGTTVRRISGVGGDRIVIRNRFTYDASMEVSDKRVAKIGKDHDQALAARFPSLAGIEMDYRWGGRLCLSYNNVQVIGEIEEGLFTACVQNGLGTARGTLAGMLAADLACDVPSEALTRARLLAQPSRLPPEPLASLGANLRLKWGERRAGAEL